MAQETNINAYKAELVKAELDLDRAKSRVQALRDYIEAAEPTKKDTAKTDNKKAPAELPEKSKGEKVEVKTLNKKGRN